MARDLLTIDDLTLIEVNEIYKKSQEYFLKSSKFTKSLSEKLLVNFFFENSTRTRTSFEIAAKNLGAEVVNIDISLSSLKKGESIIDMTKTINAMNPDFVAIRHNSSGIASLLKPYINCSLINAGDGTNEHPSQALLDGFVISQYKKDLKNLTIAICGDVLHSRVARSNIKLLNKFGCKIKVVTPPTLMPQEYKNWLKEKWQIEIFDNLQEGIKNVDVIMMLRIQQERMVGCYIPSMEEYSKIFGLNKEKLKNAKKDVIILHPGPINRDIEIASDVADNGEYSLILTQVEAGVSVRMALLDFLVK